jgi:chromosome segregation ATPase
MTGEELERAIDFLLKSQATLEARIEQVNDNLSKRIEEVNQNLSSQLAELKNRLDQHAQTQSNFIQVVTRTFGDQAEINRRHEETDRRLAKAVEMMAETQRGLAETQRGLAETQRGLAENQSDTDKRLNALIDTVERYISGRRGDER